MYIVDFQCNSSSENYSGLKSGGKTPGEAAGFHLGLEEWDLGSSEDNTGMGVA